MSTVTISSKYQVVIPQEVRETFGLRPGQKLAFFTVNGQIRLVPVKPIQQYRGLFKGMPTTGFREKKDRAL
jgi:AbrB family looped-hinge helix DNA binding protein